MRHELEPNDKWAFLAAEANYRPVELARLCGVSLRTLQRHFRNQYKLTIREWIRAIRLQKAYVQLTSGQAVKQVCFDLAYKQVSHFSRDFKSFYGVSPGLLSSTDAPDGKWIQIGIKSSSQTAEVQHIE
jgi:AraC-like DNA-binding protein